MTPKVYIPYLVSTLPTTGAEQPPPPFQWAGDVHAISFPVPTDRATAPAEVLKMNWYDWGRSNNVRRPDPYYLNMVFRYRPGEPRATFRDERRPLLLFNEPEYSLQAGMTPSGVADGMHIYRDYPGEVFGCGYGYQYFDQFTQAQEIYLERYGRRPYLDGVHMHVYVSPWANLEAERPLLRRWREWAGARPIIVSEYGWMPYTSADPAWLRDRVPELVALIQEELDPWRMFWFSWRMADSSQDVPGVSWQMTNAADGPIGQGWRSVVGV